MRPDVNIMKYARYWDLQPSPFPPLKVPPLEEAQIGDWVLVKEPGRPLVRGYFRGLQPIDVNWVLANYENPEQPVTWMSVTPMELESQSHHLQAARGDVLVGGMGLGILVYNLAQKATVKSITVVERDPRIISLVEELAKRGGWSGWTKVTVIEQDMLEFSTHTRYDCALIDIWPGLGDMALRKDMQRIAVQVPAREYAGWGQELDFISWCREQHIEPERIQGRHWPEYGRAIRVPLIMSKNRRMAQYALRAAQLTVIEALNPTANTRKEKAK